MVSSRETKTSLSVTSKPAASGRDSPPNEPKAPCCRARIGAGAEVGNGVELWIVDANRDHTWEPDVDGRNGSQRLAAPIDAHVHGAAPLSVGIDNHEAKVSHTCNKRIARAALVRWRKRLRRCLRPVVEFDREHLAFKRVAAQNSRIHDRRLRRVGEDADCSDGLDENGAIHARLAEVAAH
eukprot:6212592-Pleurochrysis_carterae.AAC.1